MKKIHRKYCIALALLNIFALLKVTLVPNLQHTALYRPLKDGITALGWVPVPLGPGGLFLLADHAGGHCGHGGGNVGAGLHGGDPGRGGPVWGACAVLSRPAVPAESEVLTVFSAWKGVLP